MSDPHLAPPPDSQRTAHWSRPAAPAAPVERCWNDGCLEPIADGSDRWCLDCLASLPADVARAEAWLKELGYSVGGEG